MNSRAIDNVQTERVLSLVDELANDSEPSGLEEIDAAFYWRCCRLDFVQAVEPLREEFEQEKSEYSALCEKARAAWRLVRAALAAEPGEEPHQAADTKDMGDLDTDLGHIEVHLRTGTPLNISLLAISVRAESVGAAQELTARPLSARTVALVDEAHQATKPFRESLEVLAPKYDLDYEPEDADDLTPFHRTVTAISRDFGLPYPSVMSYITDDRFVLPHAWRMSKRYTTEGDRQVLESVSLDLFSGWWTGERVATLVDLYVIREHNIWPPEDDHHVALRIDFARVTDATSGRRFVRVIVGLPLPPIDLIEHAYDAIMRQEHWKTWLAAESNSQQHLTAIRTWAVGLVAAAGWDANQAIRIVTERAGWDREISQERFNQDRRLLIERFPEAWPYLFRRKPRVARNKG